MIGLNRWYNENRKQYEEVTYKTLVDDYRTLVTSYKKSLKRRARLLNEEEVRYLQSLGLDRIERDKVLYIKSFHAFRPASKQDVHDEYKICHKLFFKFKCLETNDKTKDKFGVSGSPLEVLKHEFTRKDIYENRSFIEFEYGRAFYPIEEYLVLRNFDLTNTTNKPVKSVDTLLKTPERDTIYSKILDGTDDDNLTKTTEDIKDKVKWGPITVFTVGQTTKTDMIFKMLNELKPVFPNSEFTAVQWYNGIIVNKQQLLSAIHDMNDESSKGGFMFEDDRDFKFPDFNAELGVVGRLTSKFASILPGTKTHADLAASGIQHQIEECNKEPTFKDTAQFDFTSLKKQRFTRNNISRSVVFITIYDVSYVQVSDGEGGTKTIKNRRARMSLVDLPGFDDVNYRDITKTSNNYNELFAIDYLGEFFKLLCFNKQRKKRIQDIKLTVKSGNFVEPDYDRLLYFDTPNDKSSDGTYAQLSEDQPKESLEKNLKLVQLVTAHGNIETLIKALKLTCNYMLGIFNIPDSQVVLLANAYHSFDSSSKIPPMQEKTSLRTFKWVNDLHAKKPKLDCADIDPSLQGGTLRHKATRQRSKSRKSLTRRTSRY
jgi:hypothetical protein